MKTAKSVEEYISLITGITKEKTENTFHQKVEFLFRGQADKNYRIVPSLGRYDSGYTDICFVERNMIEEARNKLPNIFQQCITPLELLSLLQHYGIPTRLLDLTENALVALFFACLDERDKDGEVLVFRNEATDIAVCPIANAVADSYRLCMSSWRNLENFYGDMLIQDYFDEQREKLKRCYTDNKAGAIWIEKCCSQPIFVQAPLRLDRQRIQQGRYILFPNEISHKGKNGPYFRSRIKAMPKNHSNIAGRIIIPTESKAEILLKLKMLGINRTMLFADSPDIVCEEIKKKYFKKAL